MTGNVQHDRFERKQLLARRQDAVDFDGDETPMVRTKNNQVLAKLWLDVARAEK
jgi:hypothetical protein